MTDLPIPQSFWISEGALLGGQYPGDKFDRDAALAKLRALVESGVTAFVDLTHAGDYMEPYEALLNRIDPSVARSHLPIEDLGVPSQPRQMQRILDFIDAEVGRSGLVYLHCWGGHGRTNTAAGCWLRRHGYGPQEALDELHRLRQASASETWRSQGPQTRAQERYVREWNE